MVVVITRWHGVAVFRVDMGGWSLPVIEGFGDPGVWFLL